MTELSIRETLNGYILTWYEEQVDDDGRKFKEKKELSIEEIDENENDAMKRMLEQVAEYFGYCYDKYGEENLDINFSKKGYKLE